MSIIVLVWLLKYTLINLLFTWLIALFSPSTEPVNFLYLIFKKICVTELYKAIYTLIQICNIPPNLLYSITFIDISNLKQFSGGNIMSKQNNQNKKNKYISDIINRSSIIHGKINLIEAPCSTGKTTFFINELVLPAINRDRIIYLVDTSMLEESLISNHEKYLKPFIGYSPSSIIFSKESPTKHGFGSKETIRNVQDNRAICMTYAKFSNLIKSLPDEEFLNKIEYLCCDEVHNLANYINFDIHKGIKKEDTKLFNALDKIIKYTDKNIFKTIFMTATPYRIKKLLLNSFDYVCNIIVKQDDLRGHTFKSHYEYTNINNIVTSLKNYRNSNQKFLMYFESIRRSLDIRAKLEEIGFTVACLWSINNPKRMDEVSLRTRNHIIKHEEIPHDIDIVIINAAYETGYNIFDKDNRIQTVIIHSTIKDVITQVRGRIRHNLKSIITYKNNNSTTISVEFDENIIKNYLNIPLTKEKKSQLVEQLNMLNTKNSRSLKWNSIKNLVIQSGYVVSTNVQRINGKCTRFDIISHSDFA